MISPGFSKYNIEPDGTITRIDNGRVIKHSVANIRGYTYVRAVLQSDAGKYACHGVLNLLAITFLGKTTGSVCAMPKDGNALNVILDNVELVGRSELAKRSHASGKPSGRRKDQSRHNPEQVRIVYNVMNSYGRPFTMAELSDKLQIPYSRIRYVMNELRNRGRVRKTKEGFEVIR